MSQRRRHVPVLGELALVELGPSKHEAEAPAVERAVNDFQRVGTIFASPSAWRASKCAGSWSPKYIMIVIPKKRLIVGTFQILPGPSVAPRSLSDAELGSARLGSQPWASRSSTSRLLHSTRAKTMHTLAPLVHRVRVYAGGAAPASRD